jgi:GrpB-like predicted nucleotidyltransferase (UPF0157 family)
LSEADRSKEWQAQYLVERERLVRALGMTTDGGVVEAIQHVGSTSVPGLPSSGRVDVALAVSPFPLEPQVEATLIELGYEKLPAGEVDAVQRYRSAGCELFTSEAGGRAWTDSIVLRDYLREVPEGRRAYAAQRAAGDGGQRFDVLLAQARTWWVGYYGFAPVQAVADELAGFGGQWYVAGGWALDLWLGQVGRVHNDVDVVVARADQMALQEHLLARDWKLLTPLDGRLAPWPRHMRLELPRHQVHAHRDEAFIDFLLTDLSGGLWHYRRAPGIFRTLDRAARRTEAGLPYLAPEVPLLFKSKNTSGRPRPGDQADFERVYRSLGAEQRAWLRWALTATEAGHEWIALLA